MPPAARITSDEVQEAPVIYGQLRAPRRWEQLLVDAAVIGGRDRWHRRIAGLASELRVQLGELDKDDEARTGMLHRTLADLEAFAGYALPLVDALATLPRLTTWGNWLDELGALATRALRHPDRVLSVLSELAPMATTEAVSLDEVLLVLSDLLLQVAVPPTDHRYGRVFIAPIEATRGMSFDTVFVPGLAEKLFPHKIVEEPILLDSVRAQLNLGLSTNPDRVAQERLALALAVGSAERRLYLSYPRLDLDQSRPRVPSFYALEAVRAAEGQLPDFTELGRRAETVTETRIGWPAPRDIADAIDDAEHDLVLLEKLLALKPDEAIGTGRYLLERQPIPRARPAVSGTSLDQALDLGRRTCPAIRGGTGGHGQARARHEELFSHSPTDLRRMSLSLLPSRGAQARATGGLRSNRRDGPASARVPHSRRAVRTLQTPACRGSVAGAIRQPLPRARDTRRDTRWNCGAIPRRPRAGYRADMGRRNSRNSR